MVPDIKRHLERWDAFDVATASTAELQAHFEEMWEEAIRLFDLHFQIVIPVYVALALFDDLHHDLFADNGAFESQKLLHRQHDAGKSRLVGSAVRPERAMRSARASRNEPQAT